MHLSRLSWFQHAMTAQRDGCDRRSACPPLFAAHVFFPADLGYRQPVFLQGFEAGIHHVGVAAQVGDVAGRIRGQLGQVLLHVALAHVGVFVRRTGLGQLPRQARHVAEARMGRGEGAELPAIEQLGRRARALQQHHLHAALATSLDFGMGGIEDIRPLARMALHGSVLTGEEFVHIKTTLISAREVLRSMQKSEEEYPQLQAVIALTEVPTGIVDLISRCISERGEVLDSASERLAQVRRDLKISHDRLLGKLERILNDPHHSPMLQESIITQRDGRYVIPLRSEFKGQIKSIVHDQSSSGATLFVEPLVVVELNNQLKEYQLAERDEERRILSEITTQVGFHAEVIAKLIEDLAKLDVILAKARYADSIQASEPILKAFPTNKESNHPGSVIRLFRARHPLLDPKKVVPIDLDLGTDTYALIITGPNTGGKTVTLKTLGLLAVMAQAGLHIPALSGSEISIFDFIFADIGDEQSIEQSLSTFSGHITNIIQILKKADRRSLVLLDELGAGTDPQEGAALAMAIVNNLLQRNITCMVATHYPELKSFAHSTPGVMNASLEFDLATLKPTYHLSMGLPGRSNALAIAEKLGLPMEIISNARKDIHPDELKAEDLLDEIYQQRTLAREAREDAQLSQEKASKLERELTIRLERVEDERIKMVETTRQGMEAELNALHRELDDVRRALNRAKQPLDAIRSAEEKLEKAEDKVDLPVVRQQLKAGSDESNLKIGMKVIVTSIGMGGVVTGLTESDAEVQIGRLRLRARFADLSRPGAVVEEQNTPRTKVAKTAAAPAPTTTPEVKSSPGMELDIRGQRAENALDLLDRYLDSAYSTGLPFVRIIHGKGTGRLRQVIREALQASPHVKRFASGMDNEGGDGVTVAHLDLD